jgi:hypothetical protein
MTDTTGTTGTTPVNEITKVGKFWAGVLLIFLTSAAIVLVIAYWPNKMPAIKDGDDGAWYTNQLFNITLVIDCNGEYSCDSLRKKMDSVETKIRQVKDTVLHYNDSAKVKIDSTLIKKWNDSLKILVAEKAGITSNSIEERHKKQIHLNTILLILVALMGFLGNMVHIATSFTTFVGNETFKRSWILWYFVKPFTASGLAIIVYFIIRAGFLSYGSGASGVSLYGILSLAAFAGLFTDSATLKLKEVFEVIFKPKDERNDRLQNDDFTVSSLVPETIPADGEAKLTLTGNNLNKPNIKITIDGTEVTAAKTADKIEINYKPTEAAITAGKAILLITDNLGKILYPEKVITIK